MQPDCGFDTPHYKKGNTVIPSEDLDRRFNYHPADTEEKQRTHEHIREICLTVANDLNLLVPDGREKSLAITHLEEVMMWANAAIARQGR